MNLKNEFMKKYRNYRATTAFLFFFNIAVFYVATVFTVQEDYWVLGVNIYVIFIISMVFYFTYKRRFKSYYNERSQMINYFYSISPVIGKDYSYIREVCGQEDNFYTTTNNQNKLETVRTWFGYEYVIVLIFDLDMKCTAIKHEQYDGKNAYK